MRLRTEQSFDRRLKAKVLGLSVAVVLLLAGMARSARAQQRNDNTPNPSSNLALQNLKQVAGSAPEIRAVLTKDPGLLVELKRWVAKDATEHGQVVGDSAAKTETGIRRPGFHDNARHLGGGCRRYRSGTTRDVAQKKSYRYRARTGILSRNAS